MNRTTVTILSMMLGSIASTSAQSLAQEFRVETEVFDGIASQPVSETLTLFSGDLVYDFLLTKPEEITILDLRRNRIVLLDKKREVQTTLGTTKLLQFTAQMKAFAAEPKVTEKELFDPKFTEEFDPQKGELKLQGKILTYRTVGIKPKFAPAIRQYREFADWYARLNAMRRQMPPFARIELNRALAEKGLVPQEVVRTVVARQALRNKKMEARSRHSFLWTLSNSDRKRIEDTGEYQAKFREITLREYWGI